YVIDTPPPFTSGELHMGNMLNIILYDIVAKQKRMKGYNVLMPSGWDAQGFPTERAVEKKFGSGIKREEFYKKCLDMSEENAKKMKAQLDAIGIFYDDRYEYKTTSNEWKAKVQLSLLQMYKNGFVYRGAHPVLWCPRCASAIANAEVEDKEEETTFNYIDFSIPAEKNKKAEKLVIATTRPELLHACVAIAVNPKDKKNGKLVGRKAKTPIFGKLVSIIGDDKVDPSLGTGAEMVCTFGDKEDVQMFHRHGLGLIEAIDEHGRLKNAGEFDKLGTKEAREKIIEKLKKEKLLAKQESIKHWVRLHDRCSTQVEYLNSMQWFIKVLEHKEKIKQIANEVKWYPDFGRQRLIDWVNYIDWDWPISRNRVYGTPLPFWYCPQCGDIVPADEKQLPVDPVSGTEPPFNECRKCGSVLVGESLTCDVWLDSSITPFAILGWPKEKDAHKRLPVALRTQGTEIIRTWAFYTIFRTWALTKQKPWEKVMINGMVLGFDGRIMHKSYGNGLNTSDLFAKGYPIDSIRLWVALSGAIGKDRQFAFKDIDFAKSFITKLYNSAVFVKGAIGENKIPKDEPKKDLNVFDIWILNRLNTVTKAVADAYDEFNFFEASNALIDFYWHEFCDYYLENVKHRVYSKEKSMQKSKEAALFTLDYVLRNSIRLLAPITSFTCEEINSMFDGRGSIFNQRLPEYVEIAKPSDYVINGLVQKSAVEFDYEGAGALLNQIISEVRKEKAKNKLALNYEITSININVPDEYYNVVSIAEEELKQILKSKKVAAKKSKELSVKIDI
ncbi:MAG: valine--tRNA ligase, partial [Candidatus Marsarchaeota archaeon]|nr:valine--tRNA ligase [Candidatus Marsarchaeota archaeon]